MAADARRNMRYGAVRSSGREPFVTMMKPTDLWESDDPASARWLHAAGFGAILRERQMCPPPMIIVAIGLKDLPEMTFVQDIHMIQALFADRSDDALRLGVLPG